MRTQVTFAALALVGTLCVNAGFMGQAADKMFDESQKQYIDGVAVYPVNESAASQVSYYDWENQMDWSQMGVQTYNYTQKQYCGGSYYASECPQSRYFRPCTPYCFPYCAPSCQYYIPTCTSVQNCTIPAQVPVNCTTNTTNTTVPVIPPPSNATENVTIVVTNCTMFKTCRERPACGSSDWWGQWNIDKSSAAQSAIHPSQAAAVYPYQGYGGHADGCANFQCNSCFMCVGIACQQQQCNTCCDSKKVVRKRICNATEDDSFDVGTFMSNTTYYNGCDCVIFTNCTNTTQTVPSNQTTPVIPVPPIPPSGSACNYSCEDIRDLHIAIDNLTQVVASQQNDIDMLIGKYQEIASKSGSASDNSCCSKVDSINQEISDLYNIVNNITLDATNETLSTIQRDGLRLGNNWWVGEQGAYLFAIDITDSTWYRFDPNVNRTL